MSSFAELMVYADRRRLRIGLTTNSKGASANPDGRVIAIELLGRDGEALDGRWIAKPGTSAELDVAAAELLAELRGREDDGA